MSSDLQHKPGLVTESGPRLRVPAIFPLAKLSKVKPETNLDTKSGSK